MWELLKNQVIAYYPCCGKDTYPLGLFHHARLNQWRREGLGAFPLITDWIYLDGMEAVQEYWWNLQQENILYEDEHSQLIIKERREIDLGIDTDVEHPLGFKPMNEAELHRDQYQACHPKALCLKITFTDLEEFDGQNVFPERDDWVGHFDIRLWFVRGDSYWFAAQMAQRQAFFTYFSSPCDGSGFGGNYEPHIKHLRKFFNASTLASPKPSEAYYLTDDRRYKVPNQPLIELPNVKIVDGQWHHRYSYAVRENKNHNLLLFKYGSLDDVENGAQED